MPADIKNPYYVRLAERLMRDIFGIDLWRLKPEYRTRIILLALDNEKFGDQVVEIIIYDEWREIRRKLKKKE